MELFFIDTENEWERVAEGIYRKIVGHTSDLMATLVRFDKGAIGEPHSHEIHDQIAYVAAGSFETEINGEKRVLRRGDAYIAPKRIRHGVVALEQDSILVDMFSPRRDDFLQG